MEEDPRALEIERIVEGEMEDRALYGDTNIYDRWRKSIRNVPFGERDEL